MVGGTLRYAAGSKQNSPWLSEMSLSKTYGVDHYVPQMSSHKHTIFPYQGQQHMMGEHMLEWIEQYRTCSMENEMLEYSHTACYT